MKPRFLFAALAAVYASYSAGAHAQAFLGDPRLAEGLGIQAGAFELHPGVAAEGGYDSNWFVRSGKTNAEPVPDSERIGNSTRGNQNAPCTNPDGSPNAAAVCFVPEPSIPSWRLRLTPSLSFTTFGRRERQAGQGGGPPPTAIFGGNLSATYNALFPTGAYKDQVNDQNNVALMGGLNANIFPQGRWGVDGSVDYARYVDASNDIEISNAFRRNTIRGGVGLNWRPGGGLFSWRAGYGITANLFENGAFKDLNNLQHRLEMTGRWKFLPRTALFYRGDVSWLSYTSDNKPQTLGDGTSLRSQLGLNGLITNYFGILVLGGWASSFWEPAPSVPARNFDSITAQAELTYYPSPQKKLPEGGAPVGLSQISVGYVRSFSPSYLGSFYQRDRGYANMTYFFAQRFVMVLSGGLNHISRPEAFFPGGEVQFGGGADNRVDGQLFFEYRPGPAVGINTTLRADAVLNDVAVKIANTPDSEYDNVRFARYQAFLGVRWFL